jgi:hypothetical protein
MIFILFRLKESSGGRTVDDVAQRRKKENKSS